MPSEVPTPMRDMLISVNPVHVARSTVDEPNLQWAKLKYQSVRCQDPLLHGLRD